MDNSRRGHSCYIAYTRSLQTVGNRLFEADLKRDWYIILVYFNRFSLKETSWTGLKTLEQQLRREWLQTTSRGPMRTNTILSKRWMLKSHETLLRSNSGFRGLNLHATVRQGCKQFWRWTGVHLITICIAAVASIRICIPHTFSIWISSCVSLLDNGVLRTFVDRLLSESFDVTYRSSSILLIWWFVPQLTLDRCVLSMKDHHYVDYWAHCNSK